MTGSHLLSLSILLSLLCYSTNAQNETTICVSEINCRARGVCINDASYPNGWYCLCNDGYTTFPEPDVNSPLVYCNYQQKDQLVAFLLSFFVGFFAAGRFYVEDFMMAGIKIGLNVGIGCIGGICLSCVAGVSGLSDLGSGGAGCCACFAGLYGCVVSLAITGWLIADWVLFGINDITDGNGVELKPW